MFFRPQAVMYNSLSIVAYLLWEWIGSLEAQAIIFALELQHNNPDSKLAGVNLNFNMHLPMKISVEYVVFGISWVESNAFCSMGVHWKV